MVYVFPGRDDDFRRGDNPMLKTIVAATAVTVLIGMTPALAQEQPTTTPTPEAEQAPTAKTDPATAETKKPESAAHPRPIHHPQFSRHVWPWDWAWYQLRRELRYLQHHRV
jgi:hypothetical protein